MSKIVKCDRNISPFGGINFIVDLLNKKRVPRLLDEFFSPRVKQAKYSYSDIFLAWMYSIFCGAGRLEDVMAIKDYLKTTPGLKVPSSDRISQIFRSLATDTISVDHGKTNHQYNINLALNGLMVDTALYLGQIDPSASNVVDFDNTVIPNQKWDSRVSYVHEKGYHPGVAFIKQTPVYIENRNGNSNAQFIMDQVIGRALKILRDRNVRIDWFRSDSAAYNTSVLELLDDERIKFVIKAMNVKWLRDDLDLNDEWEDVGFDHLQATSSYYTPKRGEKEFRYVIYRRPDQTGTLHRRTGERYFYFALVTNDHNIDPSKLISFYNRRGAIERNFDDLKNNFYWKHIPFSYLNENAVFLILSGMASIIYRFCIEYYSKKLDFVKKNFRLKNFRFHFILLPSWWKRGRLYLDTSKGYEVLLE